MFSKDTECERVNLTTYRQRRVSLTPQPRQPEPQTKKDMTAEMQTVADMVTANTIFTTKEVLTSDEAARYMGVYKSYLYKLTMRGEIPHYKPMGKMCYFNRAELEAWLQQNRCATASEISDNANRYMMKGGRE